MTTPEDDVATQRHKPAWLDLDVVGRQRVWDVMKVLEDMCHWIWEGHVDVTQRYVFNSVLFTLTFDPKTPDISEKAEVERQALVQRLVEDIITLDHATLKEIAEKYMPKEKQAEKYIPKEIAERYVPKEKKAEPTPAG